MKITTGQFVAITQKLEKLLWAKADLLPTSKDHPINTAEKALYLDHLVNELNEHFSIKRARSTKQLDKVECKFNLWAIFQAYPPTLHKVYPKSWMPILQKDIQTEEDFKACLSAVNNYRQYRLAEESKLSTNRKFTKSFVTWVKEWRAWIPEEAKVETQVLDASEMGF